MSSSQSSNGKAKARSREESATDGSEQNPSRRKLGHVTRACNVCRRKKMKCDGNQPSCTACILYKEDCVYKTEPDGRRPAPRAYVVGLEQRVKDLEDRLRRHGDGGLSSGRRGESSVREDDDAEDGEEEELRYDSGLDRLKVDEETGELLQYGPTSAFKHLAEPDPLSTSPIQTSPLTSLNNTHYSPEVMRANRSLESSTLQSPELSDGQHEEVMGLFFSYFNPWCCWVDEYNFRQDWILSPAIPGTVIRRLRTAFYSPLLHNAILSIAISLTDMPKDAKERMAAAFARRAKDLMEEEAESPMLSTVSGLLLVGSYHSGSGRQGIGYVYSGIGLRLTQVLGLGVNCQYWVNKGVIKPEIKKARDRVFFTAYMQDKLWSTYVGRAASMLIVNQETQVPIAEEYEYEDNAAWAVPSGSEYPEKHVQSWQGTCFLWSCKLSFLAEKVLNTIYSIRFDRYADHVRGVVSDQDSSLAKWRDSLPECLRIPRKNDPPPTEAIPAHVLTLNAMSYFLTILLHRPFHTKSPHADRAAAAAEAGEKCTTAAAEIAHILSLYDRCPGLRFCPIALTQITFTAGTVYLMNAAKADPRSPEDISSVAGVRTCISALRSMSQTFRCAGQSASILSRMLEEWSGRTQPDERPADAPVDIETMLRTDPKIAEQLRRLGWAPPSQPPAPPQQSMSFERTTPVEPIASDFALDWSMFQNLGTTQPASLPAGAGPVPVAPSIFDSLFSMGNPTQANFNLPGGAPWSAFEQFLTSPNDHTFDQISNRGGLL